jgi:hypothetical protein
MDDDLRTLERQVRAGDKSARVLLTLRRIRACIGFVLAWEGKTAGTPLMWVARDIPNAPGHPECGSHVRRRKKHAFSVLDLSDAFELVHELTTDVQIPPINGFQLIDLATKRVAANLYPSVRLDVISLEPLKARRVP